MATRLEVQESAAELLWHGLKLEGFFPEFRAEHARKLFPRSELCLYPRGAVIVSQGDTGQDLFIIQSGEVGISKTMGSAGARLKSLGPGELFGEMGLLGGGVRTATAVAEQDSCVYRLDHRDLDYLMKHNASLKEHLGKLAAKRR